MSIQGLAGDPAKMLRARNMQAINALHNFLERFRNKDRTLKRGAVSQAAKAFGVTRPTIYAVLKEYPEPAHRQSRKKRMEAKYVQDFKNSTAYKRMLEVKGTKKKASRYLSVGQRAWLILNKKDPLSWDEQDYKLLWNHPEFKDKETGKLAFGHAVSLRQWMQIGKLYDLMKSQEFDTKGLKRAKGRKLTHWITNERDFEKVINALEYPDTLMMFNIGIQCGARFSSLRLVKPSDIQYMSGSLKMIEPKLASRGKELVERYFIQPTMENLRRYIAYFDFKYDKKIFPRSLANINEDLKQAGVAAGIPFPLTTHVAMKHTFVSFASNHGVSLDIVARQAHTDAQTLMDFYAGIGSYKIGYELLGKTEHKAPDFAPVMARLQAVVSARFDKIKDRHAEDATGKRRKGTAPRKKKRRMINWAAIRGIIDAKGTLPHIREVWKRAMKLHKAGKTDAQVRKEMGWK